MNEERIPTNGVDKDTPQSVTARYWDKREGGGIACRLCPHRCVLTEGAFGRCGVRRVREGALEATGYGAVSGVNLDPVEKKPLYHYYPGRKVLSVGGWGCNLSCSFCQNWSISQHVDERVFEANTRIYPAHLVGMAKSQESIGIAYTYNEPLVGIEYVEDCAALAREDGLKNILVTNGFVLPDAVARLLPLLDAVNLDIKSMDDSFYRRRCGGQLAPVLEFARLTKRARIHLEITCLSIPGWNTDSSMLVSLSDWIADQLGQDTPLHLSAYSPRYHAKQPSTPPEALDTAREICRKRLTFVYTGNVVSESGQTTVCPSCGRVAVSRRGYTVTLHELNDDGRCGKCGAALGFVV